MRKYHQVCPILKEAGVNVSNAGYGEHRDMEEANKQKEICLECPLEKCLLDMTYRERLKFLRDEKETKRRAKGEDNPLDTQLSQLRNIGQY